jgi:hypothetical protein
VGYVVGLRVGDAVGCLVGLGVGAAVGCLVGFGVGDAVGLGVGDVVGCLVGLEVGSSVVATHIGTDNIPFHKITNDAVNLVEREIIGTECGDK